MAEAISLWKGGTLYYFLRDSADTEHDANAFQDDAWPSQNLLYSLPLLMFNVIIDMMNLIL